MSLFKAPVSIIKKLESIRRNFLWGVDNNNNIRWIKWSHALKNKASGGLGIGSLKAKNLSLLAKWWWRLKHEKRSLWARVIKSKYGPNSDLNCILESSNSSAIWPAVIKCGNEIDITGVPFSTSIIRKIGDGLCAQFWHDLLLQNTTHLLKKMFPRLYALDTCQDACVAS
ncbi:uncharacterized mitochondrial protein AtMg00310-like [Rutidosis leptorrhynchoides]|uniref:uncharacterized mitochondrial protein AtMg00310-like n=1 Tax=Rutidosis leptorrhynchoides TaxID=125765 RepID=UPI003A99CDB4